MNRMYQLIFTIIAVVMITAINLQVNAQDKDNSSTKSSTIKEKLDKNVEQIKENIATMVAELIKKNSLVITGNIITIKDDSLIIKSSDGQNHTLLIDEVTTEFIDNIGKQKNIEKKDLSENDYLVTFGNLIDTEFSANYIYRQNEYIILSGEITNVNAADFSLEMITPEKDAYTVDIETKTTREIVNIKTIKQEKIGFSKFKIGDKIHIVAYRPKNKQNRFSALKILIVPQEYFNLE